MPCDILVDFRTKTEAGEAPCAGVENKYRKLCGTNNFGPQPPSFKGKSQKVSLNFYFLRKKSKTDIVFLKRNRNLTYLINRAVANCLVRGLKINTKGEFYYGI